MDSLTHSVQKDVSVQYLHIIYTLQRNHPTMVKRPFWLGPMLVVVLAALQLQDVSGVSGNRLTTRSHCPISGYPLVTLSYDPETDSYRLENYEDLSDGGNVTGNSTRFLRQSSNKWSFENDIEFDETTSVPAIAIHRNAQSTTSNNTQQESIQVRPCVCAGKRTYPEYAHFCPLSKAYCYIPFALGYEVVTPTCVNETGGRSLVKALWPIVVVWMSLLIICIFGSIPGRNAIGLCISTIFPCWNRLVANNMLKRNPVRANKMIRRAYFRRRRVLEQRYLDTLANTPAEARAAETALAQQDQSQPEQRPTKLALKTRIYDSRKKDSVVNKSSVDASVDRIAHVEDTEGHTCTICLAPIEDGDRVGALVCTHIFHVECLKGWLKRRNVCPLCMQTDVATAHYDTLVPSEQASTQELSEDEADTLE